jgi:hypothetical protein
MNNQKIYAYALEIEAHTGSELIKLYISSSPAIVTSEFDTPPDLTFDTGLIQAGNYSLQCFANGKTYGAASIGYGEIILDNSDGQYDFLLDYGFDGRSAVLRRIDATLVDSSVYPDDWKSVFTGTLGAPLPSIKSYGKGTISIPWRDRMIELQTHLDLGIFLGDNELPEGLEGTEHDLKNKVKPRVLGKVFEVSPPCVNTSKSVYAVSPPTDGVSDIITDWDSISNFDAVTDFFGVMPNGRSGIGEIDVYDSGVLIPQEGAYVDISEMMNIIPTSGYCRVLYSHGYVRFGDEPTGLVTVTCDDGSANPNLLGSLVRDVLIEFKGWDSYRYNADELVALDTACSIEMGTLITDGQSTNQVLDILCESAGVCYYFDTSGVFRSFQISDPSLSAPDFTLSDLQIQNISRINRDIIPAKEVTLKTQKCWSVQTSGVAGSVSADRRSWIGNEWRVNRSVSVSTGTKHLLAPKLEFKSAFAEDAQSECDRLRDLYCVKRDFIEVEILPNIFDFTDLNLGMIGSIDLSGRLGYIDRNMLLIGITADLARNKVTLTLWG